MLTIWLTITVVLLLAKPLGVYIARVLQGESTLLQRVFYPLEKLIYRVAGVQVEEDMPWQRYAGVVLMLAGAGFLMLFLILLLQGYLPFNPQGYAGVSADLAFNVAISFLTNTNWQSYAGEASLSYFSQMAGLGVQNFVSAATGIAVMAALTRGIVRKQSKGIGNAWTDITRVILYVLLPLALLWAVLMMSQGVVQNLGAYQQVTTLEGASQSIPGGPAASQVAIKMLATNGGGFFNANSAHPFENPTPLSNLLQLIAILLLPASLVHTFGAMVGSFRQSWALFIAMVLLILPFAVLAVKQERALPHVMDEYAIVQPGGNMEGKELRFGTDSSAFWGIATTATSNGSVNSAHGSMMPLSTFCMLVMMQMGEVNFGGIGSGMYGMLVYVLLTVFFAGLMVGRTPEFMGKKLGPYEIKMASLVILIPCLLALVGAAIAVTSETGANSISNPGARGFSEILYAVTSAANNNGSAMAGLNAASPFFNTLLGIIMFLGRYWLIIPVLALAGALARRNATPPSAGTLPTDTPLFVMMLIGVVALSVMTYAPPLALGPIAEQLMMHIEKVPAL